MHQAEWAELTNRNLVFMFVNVWSSVVLSVTVCSFMLARSMQTLTAYLTSYNGMNFLKSHGRDTPLFIKKQGLDQTFVECENHLWLLGPRTLPNGVRIDGGSDWFGLYRDFVRYVVMETDDLLDGLKQMYKYSLLPAEVSHELCSVCVALSPAELTSCINSACVCQ